MVAALMFGMISLVFYVIYESVYSEYKDKKELELIFKLQKDAHFALLI
jgi:hypothetical protein